jgi:hypothetical protein
MLMQGNVGTISQVDVVLVEPFISHRWHRPLPSPLWQAHPVTFVVGMQLLELLTITFAFENPCYPICFPWVVRVSLSYNFHFDRGKKSTPQSLNT